MEIEPPEESATSTESVRAQCGRPLLEVLPVSEMTVPSTTATGSATTTSRSTHPSLAIENERPRGAMPSSVARPSSSPTIGTNIVSLSELVSANNVQELAKLLKPAMLGLDELVMVEQQSATAESDGVEEPMGTTGMEESNDGDNTKSNGHFGESTYSLLYLCGVDSGPFWFGLFVYLIQIATILLTLVDIVDWSEPGNVLKIPPNVNLSVSIAQGVALLQAVAFQSDLIEAVLKLQHGWSPEVQEKHPGATYATWLFSCISQLFAGLLLLIAIFILTMQVDDVLSIMLNFTALHFMADIDDVGFYLAKSGFVGRQLKRATHDVANLQVPKRAPASEHGFFRRMWKTGVLVFIVGVLLAGWITIGVFRTSGRYICNTIMASMADDFVPALGTFNGLYDLEFTGRGLEQRGQYIERRSTKVETPGRGVFGYCNEIKAWTFRLETNASDEKGDPCDWIARSSETDTYDITEAATIQWYVRDLALREVVLEPFWLLCFDCTHEDEGNSLDCGGKGTCNNAICQCKDGRYGLRCEFESPCPQITIDARTEAFVSTRDWATDYQTIPLSDGSIVEAYDRPVYIVEYPSGSYDVVMFTGGRWALTSSEFLPRGGRIPDNELGEHQVGVGSDIGNYFTYVFHGYKGYFADYSVAFLSDYMEIGTDLDASSPVGFHWFRATANSRTAREENQGISQSINTKLLCRTCDDEVNRCLFDGQCKNGNCECPLGSSGSLCEVPPVGNGHCDPFLNSPEFKLDGGDCCESTCVSTAEYVCGSDQHGYVSMGYFFCGLPSIQWQHYPIESDEDASYLGWAVDLAGTSIAVSSMAVSEPGLDRVLIYDKLGSSWVLRDTISGDQRTFFGANIVLAAGPYNVVNNPIFRAPLTVGILDFGATLRIYRCNSDGCAQWQEFNSTYQFDLSDDGTVLARSLVNEISADKPPKVVRVYKLRDGLFQFSADVNITTHNTTAYIYSISLSGDGSRLALQSQLSYNQDNFAAYEYTNDFINVMVWNAATNSYTHETEVPFESTVNTKFPLCLALSQDGRALAYSLPYCFAFQLHMLVLTEGGKWVPITAPTPTLENCEEYESLENNNGLALSGDGSFIAFRAGSNVHVFKWKAEADSWEHIGEPFSFSHYSVSLSSDGTVLATGTHNEGIGGTVHIYSYSLPGRRVCGNGTSLLRISVTIDNLPGSLLWNLVDNRTGEVLFEEGPHPPEYASGTFVEETCVPTDACYAFTIYNKLGLGLRWPGEYAILLDGEVVGQGTYGTFGYLFDRIYFGDCSTKSCPTGMESFRVMMLACEPISWRVLRSVASNDASDFAFNLNESEVPSFCSETLDFRNCSNWVYYEACLDPSGCYALQLLSYLQASAEVVFGENKLPAPDQYFCSKNPLWVGNTSNGNCGGNLEVLHSVEH